MHKHIFAAGTGHTLTLLDSGKTRPGAAKWPFPYAETIAALEAAQRWAADHTSGEPRPLNSTVRLDRWIQAETTVLVEQFPAALRGQLLKHMIAALQTAFLELGAQLATLCEAASRTGALHTQAEGLCLVSDEVTGHSIAFQTMTATLNFLQRVANFDR